MRAIGLDVGGTKCLAVVLDDAGTVVDEHRVATPPDLPGLLAVVDDVVARFGPPSAFGIGVPAPVGRDGTIQIAPNIPALRAPALGATIGARLGVPVAVNNDAKCATVAEWRLGAGRDAHDLLLVTVGTGIGGGHVADGAVQLGAHGFAGEVGHVPVVPGGAACGCGRRGCWETVASGRALDALAREALGEVDAEGAPVAARSLMAAARAGDPRAAAPVDAYVRALHVGLVCLVNVLDPDVVVLGGGVFDSHDVLLEPLRRVLADEPLGPRADRPELRAAALGNRSGAIGAALLAAGAARAAGR